MVSNLRGTARSAASLFQARRVGSAMGLGGALCLAVLTGCVSHSGPSPDHVRLHEALAETPLQQPNKTGAFERKTNADGYHLHVAGLVECGGFLTRTQTVYGEAWATESGPDGPRVQMIDLDLRIFYVGGIFAGLSTKRATTGGEVVRQSDVIHGNFNTDLCGCARFVASATLPNRKQNLRARIEVCPGT